MSRGSVTNKGFDPTDGSLANDPAEYLATLFIYFLQNLFRDLPESTGMKWRPEEETSDLLITNEKPTIEALEQTPHITCVLGPGQFSGIGLDQLQHRTFNTGERTHTDLFPVTIAYHCQAKNGAMAKRVAWFAGYYTGVLRRILMRVGNLHHVSPNIAISGEGPPTAYIGPAGETNVVSVVVTVPFYWQPRWHITEPSTLWRNLRVQLSVLESGWLYSADQVKGLRPPMVNGVPVLTTPIKGTERKVAFTQTVLESSPEQEE